MIAYMLIDGKIVETTLKGWALWYEGFDNSILKTDLDGYTVSTIFLGIDHNFGNEGPPLIFETMVFHPDGTPCKYQKRHSTRFDAEVYHAAVVASMRRLMREHNSPKALDNDHSTH